MATDGTKRDVAALTRESREIWDAKAAFWDERMGEGNAFQRVLVGPATERLLALREGELVLDVACGNGVMARRLAARRLNTYALYLNLCGGGRGGKGGM